MSLLSKEHRSWIGQEEPSVSVDISRRDIQKYAAATEQLCVEGLGSMLVC